ncbi:MAG: BPSL1445 family SYLF domain-containing lipoprotein [Rubrivivax sp.]
MRKRNFIATGAALAALALVTAGCTTSGGSSGDPAAQRAAIDSAADSALTRLYKEAPGSQQLVASAKGMLVFPSFVSAGFIVGGASGQGVMRKGGKSTSFHRMTEASVGLLAGAQSQAVFILFLTEDALKRFESSNGWTAGADGSIALLNVGATAQVTTQTAQQPIVGYVLTNAGLMANLSLNGNRITPLNLN